MKNVLIAGSIIGVLSGVWLWVLYLIGNAAFFNDVLTIFTSGKPFKDTGILMTTAILIPIIGLYFGLKLFLVGSPATNRQQHPAVTLPWNGF